MTDLSPVIDSLHELKLEGFAKNLESLLDQNKPWNQVRNDLSHPA